MVLHTSAALLHCRILQEEKIYDNSAELLSTLYGDFLRIHILQTDSIMHLYCFNVYRLICLSCTYALLFICSSA